MAEILLHIGYPKTGSNFIYSYFRNNPGMVTVGDNLKRHYIQSGEIKPELKEEMPLEKHYVLGEEQLSVWRGETDIVGVRFKGYDIKAHQQKTCKGLYSAFPNAKILIVTRGFESAFRSMYWQYVSIGGVLNFRKFQEKSSHYLADFYDYDFLIGVYKAQFKEKVTVLPYELLQQDTEKFLKLMEEKCGLPHFSFGSDKRINASMPEKIESYQKLSAVIYQLIRPLPYSVQQRVYGSYVEALHKGKLRWLPDLSGTKQLQIEEETLRLFRGRSKTLQGDSVFQPYLKEYLISQ